MTTDRFLSLWMSNPNWWKYDENHKPVLLPSAPPKAKRSYEEYLKHQRELEKISSEPFVIDE